MLHANHKQINTNQAGEKTIIFRYQQTSGKWRSTEHYCRDYEETAESTPTIPIFVRTSEKRWPNPMYLVLMPNRRFPEIRTYLGFYGIALVNAYLKAEGFDFEFTGEYVKPKEIVSVRDTKPVTRKLLPSEVFRVLETSKWAFTTYLLRDGEITQKHFYGFPTRSVAISALRQEIHKLKMIYNLAHGWRDGQPVKDAPELGLETILNLPLRQG